MNSKRNSKRIWVPLTVAAVLYGCGGGGGDDDSPAAPPELSSITETNATKSVAAAYRAGSALFEGSATSASLASGALVTKSQGKRRPGVVAFSIDQLRTLPARVGAASPKSGETFATKAPLDVQEPCENAGGTVRIVGNVQDQVDYLLTTGDNATITFSSCLIDNLAIDGQLVLSEIVVAENTSVRFEFRNIQLMVDGEIAGIDGGFHLSMPTDADAAAPIPVALRDASLLATTNGQSVTLSGVAADTIVDFATGSFSYAMTGRIADSAAGVSVSLATAAPFRGVADTLSSGDMTIEGAKSSRARAQVSGPNELTISVDADGDDIFEKTLDPVSVATLIEG